MTGDSSEVLATIEFGPATVWEDLARTIDELGGTVNFHDTVSRLASVQLNASRLGAIADTPGVVYVEVGDRLQQETAVVHDEWWNRLFD
ncbi:MAG: hypothetical protein ACFCVK_00890 [Acidimicrobiales bacterium]